MITIRVNQALGLTVATLPDAVFGVAVNINEGDGTLIFDVATEQAADTVRGAIERAINHPVVYRTRVGCREMVEGAPIPHAAERVEERQDTCPHCDNPTDECSCERCDECNELVDDCTCRGAFRDVEASGSLDRTLQEKIREEKLPEDQIPIIIASKLDNNTTNVSKILSDKIILYNRTMGSLMVLQNEITRLTHIIGSDFVVNKVTAEIEKVRAAENMIEDIYLTSNYLIVRTKDIVTDPLDDAKKRKVGKMDFIIDLASMIGVKDYNRAPIFIRNRTRESRELQCGHVGLNGIPCFGTWTEPIIKAMKNYDIVQLVDILIRYVRQPNLDDSMGRPMRNWPVVEEVAS